LNPLKNSTTLKEGNLKNNYPSNLFRATTSTFAIDSGKWYWEETAGGIQGIYCNPEGPKPGGALTYPGDDSTTNRGIGVRSSNYVYVNNASTRPFSGGYSGVIGFALDADNDTLKIYDGDGTLFYTVDISDPHGDANAAKDMTQYKPYYVGGGTVNGGSITYNFGQDSTFAGTETAGGNSDENGIGDFHHSVPDGYLALCTANLPDPAIDPAQDATPEDHFNVVLYTGDGNTTQTVTGTGFQADWVWVKDRSTTYSHRLFDVVRGTGKELYSNDTSAEATDNTGGHLDSFDSDGFTIGGATAANFMNFNGNAYVAWNWKAGGTGVSNTDGSITSTVSANTDAGFSIVGYTSPSPQSTDETVGHGLTQKPEMIIVKNRDYASAYGWPVYHHSVATDPATDFLNLSSNAAVSDNDAVWFDIPPTDTVFTIGNAHGTNQATNRFIAYCFHSVDGFSKVGSYIGNGSATDGPFIYTGFRPKFFLVKSYTTTNIWAIFDAERNTYNYLNKFLQPQAADAEITSTSNIPDFVSNGIKIRGTGATTNGSGNKHIFLAFAESPFKYSNAR
jgi:hypothetical protein